MKSRLKLVVFVLLAFSLLFCCLPAFADQSFIITGAQMASLSMNLTSLKDLTALLRLKLDSYKQELQVTASELKQSEAKLELAESESNVFILKLSNQQTMLKEQSQSLGSAKKSLQQLRRKSRAKNGLFVIILGLVVVGLR